jgi:PIN domain nuclease of toxin-antitoxin system
VKVIIDTHCWLWLCVSPERISESVLERLSDKGTLRLLSSASVWEIAIKYQLGKLPLPVHPRDFVPTRLETTQTEILSISGLHALRTTDLPQHHRDPFDRMIIAQALVEGVPVVTVDPHFNLYDVELLPVGAKK